MFVFSKNTIGGDSLIMDNRRYRKRESSMHKSLRLIWQTSKGLVLVVLALVLGLILFFALTKKKAPSETEDATPTETVVRHTSPTPVNPVTEDPEAPTPVPPTADPTPTPTPYPVGLCASVTTDVDAEPVPGDNWAIDYLMLVNWDFRLKYTGNPENLVRVDSVLTESWYQIQNPITVKESDRNFVIETEIDGYDRGNRVALEHLDQMCHAYHEVTGYGVKVSQTGAYRNYATQDRFWNRRDKSINPPRVVPGNASEHRTGLGFDVWVLDGEKYDYKWLHAHCHEYGFILRYPSDKTKITGVTYEQWHFRYVGVEAATEMHNLKMCLEEYVKYKNGGEYPSDITPEGSEK